MELFQDQTFEKITTLPLWEYENCHFLSCDLSECDLSQIRLIDCVFDKCNLSMAKVWSTSMQHINFVDCKLHGIEWSQSAAFLFEVSFRDSLLDFGSFSGIKMQKTEFTGCHITEVNFAQADLTGSIFDRCDLLGSIFQNTILEKVDFTTARRYAIDPEVNKMKKAKFCLEWVPGLLAKYDIIVK